MWRVHRLDRIRAKEPAKLLDSESLTLNLVQADLGRLFYSVRGCAAPDPERVVGHPSGIGQVVAFLRFNLIDAGWPVMRPEIGYSRT
jgi:hypothetical protein